MSNSIYHSSLIYNSLLQLGVYLEFSQTTINHIVAILFSVFMTGYRGKTVQFAKISGKHRTSSGRFLNTGKWDSNKLEKLLKSAVISVIYKEAEHSGKPIYCTVDDTIASKTRPLSRALHPIQDAYYHYSHLKRKQDYGHQAVAVMLSCNGLCLNYAIILYDKKKSKIQIACDIAKELKTVPVPSYFLCDSWYACAKVMDAFLVKGFYTVAAVKTNRVIYPCGVKQNICRFASFIHKTDSDVSLVTVGSRTFYVYRWEGKLNDLDNAVVLISYPKDAFGSPSALRAFVCTDVSLSTEDILAIYTERWNIEVFFRLAKDKLAFDKCQLQSSVGLSRFWLLMSLAHFICSTALDCPSSFSAGFAAIQEDIRHDFIALVYHLAAAHVPLDIVLNLTA